MKGGWKYYNYIDNELWGWRKGAADFEQRVVPEPRPRRKDSVLLGLEGEW